MLKFSIRMQECSNLEEARMPNFSNQFHYTVSSTMVMLITSARCGEWKEGLRHYLHVYMMYVCTYAVYKCYSPSPRAD